MVVQAASEKKLLIAKLASELSQALGDGRKEVKLALKPILSSIENGQGGEALTPSVQLLACVVRLRVQETLRVNPILPLTSRAVGAENAGRALWVARESLPFFEGDSDMLGKAHAHLLAAFAHIECSDTAKALKEATASEQCFQDLRSKPGEAAALCASACARLLRGIAGTSPMLNLAEEKEEKQNAVKARRETEVKAGISCAKDASSIYNELDDKKSEADCLNIVGELLLAKDDVDEAKNVARESRDICQDLEDAYGEARALNLILSANMLHEEDFVDALFAAKDVMWLFRGGDISEEDEDKKAIADGLHGQAKVHLAIWELKEAQEVAQEAVKYYEEACKTPQEKAAGLAPALQCLAQAFCADAQPDEALPHSTRAVEIFAEAGDRKGEAMASAILAYQDMISRMKILDENPQGFTEESNKRISVNWQLIEEGMASAQQLREQDAEEQIGLMIHEMNKKVGELQKKMGTPTKTVWMFDRVTRKAVRKDYYEPLEGSDTQLAVPEAAPEEPSES
eukprot:gb/GFBE01012684.1/.p1 GENE.gb/GFBE01012684.1/~~gb/GFBE01012684.1/.p1  ORF type:complete len:515 (+),score=166.27 gb/GFBE01012684.1/:1-1545(+)